MGRKSTVEILVLVVVLVQKQIDGFGLGRDLWILKVHPNKLCICKYCRKLAKLKN